MIRIAISAMRNQLYEDGKKMNSAKTTFVRTDLPSDGLTLARGYDGLDVLRQERHPLASWKADALRKVLDRYVPAEQAPGAAELSGRKLKVLENFLIGDSIINGLPVVRRWNDGGWMFVFDRKELGFQMSTLVAGGSKMERRLERLGQWTSFASHPAFLTLAEFPPLATRKGLLDDVGSWTLDNYKESRTAWQYDYKPGTAQIGVARMYSWAALEQIFATFGDPKVARRS